MGATKEIAETINTAQKLTAEAVAQMHSGTKQVNFGLLATEKAGQSLGEIVAAAQTVGEMVAQIAVASAQQASAANEINNSINEIARITFESSLSTAQEAQAYLDSVKASGYSAY